MLPFPSVLLQTFVSVRHGNVIRAFGFLSAPGTTQTVKGKILWEVPHPVNFLPYQYEGYTPKQRQEFREGQLKMRFYKASETDLRMDIKNCAIRGDAK
jgi:hypothetical protein